MKRRTKYTAFSLPCINHDSEYLLPNIETISSRTREKKKKKNQSTAPEHPLQKRTVLLPQKTRLGKPFSPSRTHAQISSEPMSKLRIHSRGMQTRSEGRGSGGGKGSSAEFGRNVSCDGGPEKSVGSLAVLGEMLR